jgi:protein TonB
MPVIFLAAILVHAAAFITLRFSMDDSAELLTDEYSVLKLVDIEELPPPAPAPADATVVKQPKASENVIETEEKIIDADETSGDGIDYFPQHKISVVPGIPTSEVLARIEYPPIPLRQGIEAVVYLELFIDHHGNIRRIDVLKDPGYGFAAAAIAALSGIKCRPAMANGKPVAVRFRYPVRFALK